MTQKDFNAMMEGMDCRVLDDLALGVNSQGMPYSAWLESPEDSPVLCLRFALDGPAAPCAEYYRAKPLPHASVVAYGEILEFTLRLPAKYSAKTVLPGLHRSLRSACAAKKLGPAHSCPLCGAGQCNRYAYLTRPQAKHPGEQAFFPTHRACLESRLEKSEAGGPARETPEGSLARGAVGALLGAAIGIVPNWVQMAVRHSVSAPLYFLVPVFSTLLYRLLQGRRQKGYAFLCVALASLLAALAFEQLGYNYSLALTYGRAFGLWESMGVYVQNLGLGQAVQNMLLSLAFMLVGLIPAYSMLHGYSRRGGEQGLPFRGPDFSRKSAAPLGGNTKMQPR